MPIVLVAAALAQTPPATPEKSPLQSSPQAPPEVDAALRARVSQFYQFEVEEKYYQALQLVAEDTRNSYVGASKGTTRSYEIRGIQYAGDFTRAEVVAMVSRVMQMEGFIGHPLTVRETTHWKLENGEWCYYNESRKGLYSSPFAQMFHQVMAPPPGERPAPSHPLPPAPDNLPAPVGLTADKHSVTLKSSGPSSEQVAISNAAASPVALTLTNPKIAGLTVNLDRMALKPGEKAILNIQSTGGARFPKAPIIIVVKVQQTNQVIPIRVSFVN